MSTFVVPLGVLKQALTAMLAVSALYFAAPKPCAHAQKLAVLLAIYTTQAYVHIPQ